MYSAYLRLGVTGYKADNQWGGVYVKFQYVLNSARQYSHKNLDWEECQVKPSVQPLLIISKTGWPFAIFQVNTHNVFDVALFKIVSYHKAKTLFERNETSWM